MLRWIQRGGAGLAGGFPSPRWLPVWGVDSPARRKGRCARRGTGVVFAAHAILRTKGKERWGPISYRKTTLAIITTVATRTIFIFRRRARHRMMTPRVCLRLSQSLRLSLCRNLVRMILRGGMINRANAAGFAATGEKLSGSVGQKATDYAND